jgi:TPR repeat protein
MNLFCYQMGFGVPKDDAQAAEYYQRAAEQENENEDSEYSEEDDLEDLTESEQTQQQKK